MTEYPSIMIDRFWEKVDVRGPEDCWAWTASVTMKGYGQIKVAGTRKNVRAHQVAFVIAFGQVPPGQIVRHSCDNPPCCNPLHLLSGTHQDNTDDKISRGRARYGDQHGDLNGNAELSDSKVIEILQRIEDGETNVALGKFYGVHHATISLIRRRKTWKHLGT